MEDGEIDEGQVTVDGSGTTAGETWYCFVVVDTAEVVDETSESDNVARSGLLTVVAAGGVDPDLTGAILDAAASIYETETIDVEVSVTNEGGAPAGASVGVLYLSTTTDTADSVANSANVPVSALAPGQTDEVVASLTVPDADAPGDFYLVWVVDQAAAVAEDNAAGTAETNNESNVAVTVVDDPHQPDLEATGTTTDLPLPAALPEALAYPIVRRGDPVTITSSFEEVGAGDVLSEFEVTAWLSDDATIGAGGDLLMGTVTYTGSLMAGSADTAVIITSVPDYAATGHFYIGCQVDTDDEVSEVNEDIQNFDQDGDGEVVEFDLLERGFGKGEYDVWVNAASIDIAGGLVVSGGRFACEVYLDGEGDMPSSVTVRVYRSRNLTITVLDDLMGSGVFDMSELMFGGAVVTCTAPAYATPVVGDENDYYWGVIITAAADAVEENNSWEAGWQFTVVQAADRDVDLTAISVDAQIWGQIELDEPFLIGYEMEVNGNDDTGPFIIDFYVSDDTTIDAGDVLVATIYSPGMPAGHETLGGPVGETVSAILTTAAATAGSIAANDDVYIGMIVDADDDIPPADGDAAADNDAVSPDTFTVIASGSGAPELMVLAYFEFGPAGPPLLPMYPPTFFVRAGSTGIQWPVLVPVNMGTRIVPNAEVGFYLSDDLTVDVDPSTGDDLLGTIYVTLEAGEFAFLSDVGSLDFTGIAPGDYWLYAYIDPLDAVTEISDINNDSTSVFWGPDDYGSWVPVTVYAGAATTKPDLIGELDFEITTPAVLPADVQGDLYAVVSNSLQDLAGSSVLTLWSSVDGEATVSVGDAYLGLVPVPALEPGELEEYFLFDETDALLDVDTLALVEGTTYSIKLVVDAADEVDEGDENNVTVYKVLDCLVVEPFDTGEPGTWTVVDNGETGGTAGYETWTDESSTYMIVDSGAYGGDLDMDEDLITPVLDCTGLRTVLLSFYHDFSFADVGETAEIEISLDGGGTWEATPLASYTASVTETATIDISAVAAGESSVAIRWHYTTTLTADYWMIDNVGILGYGFGTAPAIVSVTADDPDDLGGTFDVGDTITFVFNKATNESVAVSTATTGAELGALFSVSGTFGDAGAGYTAVWQDAKTLVITVTADNGSADIIYGDTFTILAAADIQDANEWSGQSTETSPGLEGDWGKPMILSIVADDPDDSEGFFDIGDRIVITFDAPTNVPFSGSTPGGDLNTYFSIGGGAGTFGATNYNVSWSGSFDVMTISVLNGAGANIFIGDGILILAAANIQDPNESSGATTDSGTLTGDWGMPMIVSVTADGDLGSAGYLDAGDVITIVFDADTNESRAGNGLTGAQLDSLLFSVSGGGTFGSGTYDVSYTTPNVMQVTVVDGSGADVLIGDTITILAAADIQDPTDSSGATTDSGTLDGHLGTPMITSVVADDPDDSGGALGVGDTITITFDAPTNEPLDGITLGGNDMDTCFLISGGGTFGDSDNWLTWTWPTPDVLVILVEQISGVVPPDIVVGDSLAILAPANIQDANSSSGATTDSGTLTGDWGKPLVVSITADGSAGSGGYLDIGDVIWIQFDAPTNESLTGFGWPGGFLDILITVGAGTFGAGGVYNISYLTPDLMRITVVDPTDASIAIGDTITVTANADIQDPTNSSGATAGLATLGGHWGRPRVVSFYADGDAGSAGYLDAGDEIRIQFDVDTNLSLDSTAQSGASMDTLFSVNGGTGEFGGAAASYSIAYSAPDLMEITVVDGTGATLSVTDTIAILAGAGIQDVNSLSAPTTDSGTLGGHLGVPMILWVTASGDFGSRGTFDPGDVIRITFDAPTNEPVLGTPDGPAMNSLFAMGSGTFGGAGMQYNLWWADSQNLDITVLAYDGSNNIFVTDDGGDNTITIDASAGIRNVNGLSGPTTDGAALGGHLGTPLIASVLGYSTVPSGPFYSAGDVIEITFDAPTNQPAAFPPGPDGTMMDPWFGLTRGVPVPAPFGDFDDFYDVVWLDSRTLGIMQMVSGGAPPIPDVMIGDVISIEPGLDIRDPNGLSLPNVGTSGTINGDFGP